MSAPPVDAADPVALRTPPGTLLYDVDTRHSYVYEPAAPTAGVEAER